MNRAEQIHALAACEALAKALRANLNADAEAEFVEQGCAPAWRTPGFTVSAALTTDSVLITDTDAFHTYVANRFPTEIETVVVTRVRPAWQGAFVNLLLAKGEPLCDDEGTVVPGVEFRAGGNFQSVRVLPKAPMKAQLAAAAADMAAGRLPMAIGAFPAGEADDAAQV